MKACILFAALLPLTLFSQKPLVVGDTLPLSAFSLTNDGGGSLRLPDNSKKLILLDFWATNCVGCIASFPKMEKLQEQFRDEIQIILVNPETADSTRKFLAGRRFSGKKPSLPMISGSALMSTLVPFDYVPWHVWIDQEGVVKFITDGYNATPENISTFIKTGTGIMGQIYAAAITNEENIEQKAVDYAIAHRAEYYTWLAKRHPGHHWDPPRPGELYTMYSDKGSIEILFRNAFSDRKAGVIAENAFIVEAKHPENFRIPVDISKRNSFAGDNLYNFFVMINEKRKKDLMPLVRQQLCEMFNLSVSVEKRETESYVLIETGPDKKFQWNGKAKRDYKSNDTVSFSGKTMGEFLRILRERFLLHELKEPVLNCTGYMKEIYLELSKKSLYPLNLELLRYELKQFSLDIIKINTITDVLVLKEKGNN